MRLLTAMLGLSVSALAQADPESALRRLFDALRSGDSNSIRQCMTANPVLFSPGGSTMPAGNAGPAFWKQFEPRISYVRHIVQATPDSAYAVVVWRSPKESPPFQAGAMDVILRKEENAWKVFSWRDAYVPAPRILPVKFPTATNAEGWRPLFDGKSTNGWTTVTGDPDLSEAWVVEEGCLRTKPSRRRISLRTEEEFTTFELRWEWKAEANANSGVLYRLFVEDLQGAHLAGFEYQIADDTGDRGARSDDRQKSGSLYGTLSVTRPAARPLGEWNESRILMKEGLLEHWLNGVKTADYQFRGMFPSPISLQHHGSPVYFRNIKIRPIQEK